MNWKECVRFWEDTTGASRLEWPPSGWNDFDCTATFTISDVWGSFAWLYTYPGDFILRQDAVATFFEISTPATGHWLSWVATTLILMMLIPMMAER